MQSGNAQPSGIRIRVSDLLFALQKRWTVIVALSLVGLVFGLILSAMTYVQSSFQTFDISGSFAVTTVNREGRYINNATAPNNNDYHLAEDMMDAVKYVIRSDRVMNQVISDQSLLGSSARELKRIVELSQYNTTQIMEMRLTWRDGQEGVDIWNAIVEAAGRLLPETLQMGGLAVINEPQAELIGMGGSGSNLTVFLTLLGFAAGVGFAIVELLMHPTLNNVKDVETLLGLETIGVIPRDESYYRGRGSLLARENGGSTAQSFSAAAYILRNRLGTRDRHHCFYVTSATAGEGKSTVAANLAIQLSDMEHRTLLIDFDTRSPSLGSLFLEKVDYARSLNALYRGEATQEEAITTLTGYLDLLPTVLEHNAIPMDGTVIDLIQRLNEQYEYVILDAPPVGTVSDTLSLNQAANTVLFVVRYDTSTLPEIQSALEKLDKSGIRVLGCVVNGVASGRSENRQKPKKKRRAAKKEEGADADDALPPRKKSKKTDDRREEKPGETVTGRILPAKGKNLMEDLMEEGETPKAPTDQDTMDALLRMGITDDWGDEAQKEEPGKALD